METLNTTQPALGNPIQNSANECLSPAKNNCD